MNEAAGLLRSLQSMEGDNERIHAIMEWTLREMPAKGVALLEDDAASSREVSVLASLGSLSAISEMVAAAWQGKGVPQQAGTIALPAGAAKEEAAFALPVNVSRGVASSVLVLHGADVARIAAARESDLLLVSSLLREIVDSGRSERGREREKALAGLFSGQGVAPSPTTSPGLALLTDGLRLPLYVCDSRGRFTYASPAFLGLTGYPSLEALAERADFFIDSKARADELETVRAAGKLASFPLAVTSGAGGKLSIHDSAVHLDDSFFGVFFDVTALMAANAELKDSLQVQELLNDSIIAGTKTLQRTQGAAIRTLARLAEYRDPETGFHLQRICEYTRLLTVQVYERAPYSFRITREYGDDISLSCMLHDIGKVSIPDSILLKPAKLEPGEWEMMKKHTIFGLEVLHKADRELGEQSFLTLAATIALSHHEKFDGSGYPHGAAGEKIPLSSRISAVADVYDALTTARPYKEAWSHERATEEIVRQGGAQFDPVLTEIFRDVNGEFAEVRRLFPG